MKPIVGLLLRSVLMVSVLAASLALAMGPGLAAQKEYWKGRPEFSAGEAKGYFIWQDDDGWHMRWTTHGKSVLYAGRVTCNGDFTNFEAVKKEKGEIIKKESNGTIRFDTVTESGIDGIDFRLSPSTTRVTFDLNVDRIRASTEMVKIGAGKHHPGSVPFTIDRTGNQSGTTQAASSSGSSSQDGGNWYKPYVGGQRAAAEAEFKKRSFVEVHPKKEGKHEGKRSNSWWHNARDSQCLKMTVFDGRVESIANDTTGCQGAHK